MNAGTYVQNRHGRTVHPERVIAGVFLSIILLGALLLCLPFASRSGQPAGFSDALFTATSASCVTGLVVADTWTQWSFFGQLVILVMIQIGGIGFMTVLTITSRLLRRGLGLRERMVLAQSLGLNDMGGLNRLIVHVVAGTALIEGAGAVLLSVRFIPTFGWAGGIWRGIFTSISAFCNAGFDLMGKLEAGSSLMHYSGDVVVNLTIFLLIVLGGLGFFVWEDLLANRHRLRRVSVYTKLVLLVYAILVVAGMAAFLAVESGNPATMGGMRFGEKLLASLFQSITPRTAGFNTISQAGLTETGKLLTIVLMFIGGGSGSTAGGAKVVTVAVIVLAAATAAKGGKDVVVFGRRIPQKLVVNAMGVALLVLLLAMVSGMVVAATEGVPLIDALLETTSAICTVGLSAGLTASLGMLSRIILMVLMFFGRAGVMTIAFLFFMKEDHIPLLKYPEGNLFIG